jgi:hypothetical protein
LKSAIVKAPPLEGKGFSQYESVFLQLADEHRTVNAFELQELLEACLPNGKIKFCSQHSVFDNIFSLICNFILSYLILFWINFIFFYFTLLL